MKKQKPEKLFHIVDKESLGVVIRAFSKIIPSKDKSYRVRITLDSEDRSLKQNKLAFFWYKVRAGINGNSIQYDRQFCKLHYGVPLLLASDDYSEFHKFWHNAMLILPYEEQMQAMDFVPVTRLMSTKHFAEYLNTIDQESASQGIVLPQPNELYMAALMKDYDNRR